MNLFLLVLFQDCFEYFQILCFSVSVLGLNLLERQLEKETYTKMSSSAHSPNGLSGQRWTRLKPGALPGSPTREAVAQTLGPPLLFSQLLAGSWNGYGAAGILAYARISSWYCRQWLNFVESQCVSLQFWKTILEVVHRVL